ncbi:GNAT family N-acetyltransferase [Conexibacter woesei]|uniref:GNAT family N-acetyltransferase n=1 Tax=Conexibacter woesei TaxID=191495 RepID=UPI0003F5AF67|nr:GNAT family N-acetyltransferase [Conexibacter woesei]
MTTTFPIETERLRLRPIAPADVEPLQAIYAHPDVERWIGPELAADLDRSVQEQIALQAARGFSMFAIEDRATGVLLGDCGLQPLEMKGPEIEIGWDLAPHAWGRGYATEAARAVLARAFGEWSLDRVIAVIKHDNIASQRVAEKLGLMPEGERHAYDEQMLVYAAYP